MPLAPRAIAIAIAFQWEMAWLAMPPSAKYEMYRCGCVAPLVLLIPCCAVVSGAFCMLRPEAELPPPASLLLLWPLTVLSLQLLRLLPLPFALHASPLFGSTPPTLRAK
jgi:hypothetical protein